jgi:hypothetical protein
MKIKGFDYRVHSERELSAREWRDELEIIMRAGGRRRVENGETFAHAKGGGLVFECYAIINTRGSSHA